MITKKTLLETFSAELDGRELTHFDEETARDCLEQVFLDLLCNVESNQGLTCDLPRDHNGFHEADGVGWS